MAEGNMKQQFARRQYFINKKFQAGFMLKFFMVLVLGAVLSVIITMLTTQATLTSTYEGSKLVIEKTSFAIMWPVIITNIVTTTLIAAIAVVITLMASHKIAGPMFRFEKDIEEISQGDLSKAIHIRNGDQFSSVAVNLNDMVGSLNTKLQELQQELDEIVDQAEEQSLPEGFIQKLKDCQKSIKAKFQLQ